MPENALVPAPILLGAVANNGDGQPLRDGGERLNDKINEIINALNTAYDLLGEGVGSGTLSLPSPQNTNIRTELARIQTRLVALSEALEGAEGGTGADFPAANEGDIYQYVSGDVAAVSVGSLQIFESQVLPDPALTSAVRSPNVTILRAGASLPDPQQFAFQFANGTLPSMLTITDNRTNPVESVIPATSGTYDYGYTVGDGLGEIPAAVGNLVTWTFTATFPTGSSVRTLSVTTQNDVLWGFADSKAPVADNMLTLEQSLLTGSAARNYTFTSDNTVYTKFTTVLVPTHLVAGTPRFEAGGFVVTPVDLGTGNLTNSEGFVEQYTGYQVGAEVTADGSVTYTLSWD